MDGFEATGLVIRAMESLDMPYMVVGGLSSMAYGVARFTKDADIVVAVAPEKLAELAEQLGDDFELDPQGTFEMVTGTLRQHLRVPEIDFEIELFLLSDDPHDQARFERRRMMYSEILGTEAAIPSPEDVIVMKMRWIAAANRGKDIDDVRHICAVLGNEALDWDYIHEWTAEHSTRDKLDEIRASIPPLD
jgi:hypothetical protein